MCCMHFCFFRALNWYGKGHFCHFYNKVSIIMSLYRRSKSMVSCSYGLYQLKKREYNTSATKCITSTFFFIATPCTYSVHTIKLRLESRGKPVSCDWSMVTVLSKLQPITRKQNKADYLMSSDYMYWRLLSEQRNDDMYE